MRRSAVLGLIVCVVLAVAPLPDAVAQEGTPTSEAAMAGVTPEALGLGTSDLTWPDDAMASMSLFRFRFEPGGYIRIPSGQPAAGIGLVYVESGSLQVRSGTQVFVAQAAEMAQPGGQAATPVAANTEVTLEAGDSFVSSGTAGFELRNDGPGETLLLVSGIAPFDDSTPTP